MKSSRTWLILAVLAIAITAISFVVSNKQKVDNLKSIRNNWASYIYRKDVNYTYSALGGIQAFDIPVVNNTDYFVDEAIVTVEYIKASGGIYKTENITINNIPPHSEKIGRAPSSSRGTSVKGNITGIISRGLQLCYPSINHDLYDPYLCK